MLVNVLLVLVFMHFMHKHELSRSLYWYAWMFIPVKLALAAAGLSGRSCMSGGTSRHRHEARRPATAFRTMA